MQIQCHSYQNTNGIFYTRTSNPKIKMEPQKTSISQSDIEKEEQSCTILKGHSNQNNMVMTQRQTHRSMNQNREPRNKRILTWSINLQQKRQEHKMG